MELADGGGGWWGAIGDMAEKSGRVEDIAFDAEGIDRVITRLQDFKTDYLEKIKQDMSRLDNIQRPEDWVSYNVANDVQSWKTNSDDFTNRYIDRVDKLIDNLEAAKKQYLAQEEGIGGSVAGITKELDA